ncbi:MAG: ASCH domain-containing protein [archaeon]|nr:ASCH domain-containing protein [archaeon]MCR4323623.1 ASCH domain-containing protein [Nanoarchaeota archaeon]
MKALSLKQPFAELILSGKKTIELRNWNTKFRGNFLIHSSRVSDKKAMKKFGFDILPVGKILGIANLVDVREYKNDIEHEKDKKKHLADTSWGNFGFVLEDVTRIKPLDAKGMLGFWEFEYPPV